MNFIQRLLITSILVFVIAYFLPGITVVNLSTSLLVSLVLGLLNIIVKPILIFLTIPATIMTLGLFLLVINAIIVLITDHFVSGFQADGFWSALWFSIILSVGQSIMNKILFKE